MTRVLRRRFQEKISALRSSWSDTLEIGVKCFTWLFLVLDICTNPTNAGTTILIASRVPIVAAWAIIILLLFQYGEPKAEDSGMSFGSASSGSTSRALAFLRQYLYAPALTSNTLSQSVKDIFWYGVIIVIALFDLGLFADLPWKKTDFVTLSRGYPTLFVARSCLYSTMGANILQSLGSVVTFLMESKRSLFGILFMLFAAFNAVRSIVDVLLVFLMLKLLKMKEREAVSTIAYTSRNVSRDDVESMDTSLAAFRPTEIELRHSTYADRKNHIGADVVAVHQSNPIHKKPSYLRRTQGVHIDDSDSQEASVGEYRSKIKSADETNEVLRSQLIKAGIVPLEYIPLTAIKAELKVLFDAINNDRSYDEGRLDYLLMCMDLNPEYKAEKEEEARRWRAEIEPFALECLATMRGFIPPHVFSATEKSLAAQYGYSTALSKRILHKKCLWLLRMHPDCIDRVHEAELMGRFNPEAQNLDIVELAAIYAVLPLNFHKDPFEKKAKWRQSTEDALKKMVQDKNSGKLSKEKLRCAVYAGQHPAFYGRESLHSMEAVASVDAFLPRKSFLLIGSQRSPSTVYNVSGPSDSRSERSRGSLAQMAERASSAGVQNSTNDRHTFATSEELEKHLVLFEEPDGSMLDSKEMQSNTDTVSPTPLSKEVRGLVLTLQRQLNEKKGRTTS
ncbi:hypothetical protein EON65_45935 [archaeon]|nr:MAG: hypothetical protein EON65_45935 [archaeon]